jgi:RimJ/RimL family protein N-acetyltransferase
MAVPTGAPGARSPLLRSGAGQTILIGEEIYLRHATADDAADVMSWTRNAFPIAPDRIRALVDEVQTGDDGGPDLEHLVIVRQSDERPVGSLTAFTGSFPHTVVDATVDPLYGEAGLRWKGEAVALMLRHVVDEWRIPIATARLMADETAAITALERAGAREAARFREMMQRDGRRVDAVIYEMLEPAWVARLGDPAERELPRSGTSVARPVTPPETITGDPPANAVRIGPRVYLRPIQESDGPPTAASALRDPDTNWSNGPYAFSAGAFWNDFHHLQGETPPERIDFAVCLREGDALIGFVGVEDIDYTDRVGMTASEMIDPDYRGGGYGSEAKHLLFDYAFNTLGLHALQSRVLYENTRSAAALRKQGYRDAGRISWLMPRDGGFTSMCTFDLLADDWRAMPRYPSGATDS